jgi:hypothetical protein
MKTISFQTTKEESALINQIADRAIQFIKKFAVDYAYPEILMDLTACHANGNPLDFERLLKFPDFDFCHDVFGIRKHLNRETGELEGFFSPRCSKRV